MERFSLLCTSVVSLAPGCTVKEMSRAGRPYVFPVAQKNLQKGLKKDRKRGFFWMDNAKRTGKGGDG